MKVCLIVSNKFTNDARVYKEAETLSKNNFKVVVFATNPQKKLPEKEIINQFVVKRLPIETYKLRLKLHKLVSQFIPALLRLRAEKAEIYHASDLDTLMIAYLACLGRKTKLIYDSHELWLERQEIFGSASILTRSIYRFMLLQEKMLINKVDLVITVSDSIAQYLKNHYRIKKPEIVRNCPRLLTRERNQIFKDKFNLSNKKIVLYQGNLTKERGLMELVESTQWFSEDVVLILMGEGDLIKELKNYVKLKSLDKKVFFHEPVPLQDLSKYTASAEIGVIPYLNLSLNHYFSLPNKLFEYLHAGLPVVASNFPEISRIINSEKVGVTFNPSDPKDISAKINSVFSNQKKYKNMKERSIKVAKKYTWENESKVLLRAYSGVLK